MIAEDRNEPYDQVWFSGFWEDGREYSIRVETDDESGNTSSSDPVSLYIAEDSRFVPEMIQPAVEAPIPYSNVIFRWTQVPGARGYILRIAIPDYGIDQFKCDDAGYETCYLRISVTELTADLPIPVGLTGDGTLDVIVDVKAYWDSYHDSEWSEEIRFQAELPEEPPPVSIQNILEGVHMSIRETYGGRWQWSYIVCEPEVTILLETRHIYFSSNLFIEYECEISGDTIKVDLTGIGSPPLTQPACGPARAGILIYPEPGTYTLLLSCHRSMDVFSVEVTNSSIFYDQEIQDFVDSEPELIRRIRENSFYLLASAYSSENEWMVRAFHDSLMNMGCFERFEYPEGGILPYDRDCSDCEFFLYENEEDYTAAGEMLRSFLQDPVYGDGDFRITLRSWTNIFYDSYSLK